IEGDQVGLGAGGCRVQSEYYVVIGTVWRSGGIEVKFRRKPKLRKAGSQKRNVPIAVETRLSRNGGHGIGSVEDTRIRSLPTLHRLMQNTRLPVHEVRMQGERIAAEHDLALGPVLRNSDVAGSGGSPSGNTRPDSEKHHTPHCNCKIKRMRWFHTYLRWEWIAPNCSRFSTHGNS